MQELIVWKPISSKDIDQNNVRMKRQRYWRRMWFKEKVYQDNMNDNEKVSSFMKFV
jgi:hypothetical protein